MQKRFLRPEHVIPTGDGTWLVDISRPVAAVIIADHGYVVVHWKPAAHDAGFERVVVGDGVGIVVQDGPAITWVRRNESSSQLVEAVTLSAADPDVVYLVDRAWPAPAVPRSDGSMPDAPPLVPGRIVALRRDGSRTDVGTPWPVLHVTIDGDQLLVTFAQLPISHPGPHGSWKYEYPRSQVTIAKGELLEGSPSWAALASRPHDQTADPDRVLGLSWLETDPYLIRRYGIRAGGLVWFAGTPSDSDRIDRRLVVVGHDRHDFHSVVRVDAGLGLAATMRAVGQEVWLTVARRRFLAVPRDRGVEVLAVSSAGSLRSVHQPNSIDISFSNPLRERPSDEDVRSHIDRSQAMFEHLETYWRDEDGNTSPLSHGLTEPNVSIEGDWPDTCLVVTLRHTSRPGLQLRRTLALFDEEGRPVTHVNADIYLMEDLDTGYIAPASEAHNGVLDT